MKPIDDLKAKREEILSRTTTEERVKQAENLMEGLSDFGKKNFPKPNIQEIEKALRNEEPHPESKYGAWLQQCIDTIEAQKQEVERLKQDLRSAEDEMNYQIKRADSFRDEGKQLRNQLEKAVEAIKDAIEHTERDRPNEADLILREFLSHIQGKEKEE